MALFNNSFTSIIKEKIFQFDFMKDVKTLIRPLKQSIFGINGIYKWIQQIADDKGAKNVRVVFDIGASVGETTLPFLNKFPDATVYSFEPISASRSRLINRTKRFNDRVKIYNNAFYNLDTSLPFNITSYQDASSLLPMKGLENKRVKEIDTVMIDVKKLDTFVRAEGIKKIDLCKIDVEGVEKEVIEGGIETFRNVISSVIVEISSLRKGKLSDDYIKVFQMLHECGFSYIGCDIDYFFTKDEALLSRYFK